MRSFSRVLLVMLVLLLATGIYNAAKTDAEAEANNEYVKQLEEQIVLLESRISLLESQYALYEEQIVLLDESEAIKDSEIDRLWSFIRSTSDYRDLTRIVEAEASNEIYEGKMYVASVVVNRTNTGFAPTIHDVIYQPGQFSPVQNGRFAKVKVSSDSIAAVDEIIRTGSKTEALYFMNPELAGKKSRTWMRSLTYVDKVGNHEFYR